jgi:DNA-damage-inducible protein J
MDRAVRLFLVRVAEEGRIPFAVEVLNAEPRKAMEELETDGGVRSFYSR